MSDTNRGHMREVRSPVSRITGVCESLGMLGMEHRSSAGGINALNCCFILPNPLYPFSKTKDSNLCCCCLIVHHSVAHGGLKLFFMFEPPEC